VVFGVFGLCLGWCFASVWRWRDVWWCFVVCAAVSKEYTVADIDHCKLTLCIFDKDDITGNDPMTRCCIQIVRYPLWLNDLVLHTKYHHQ
jgi:hypothetical protein